VSTRKPHDKGSMGHRFIEEMRTYTIISLYLWVCFSALLLHETAVLQANNLQFLPFSIAVVKALILGKFILIGKAANIGSRIESDVLLHKIIWKSLATLLLLLVFSIIEELIVGIVHGQAISELVAEFVDRSWLQNLAPSIVMLLVLIPMISFEEIDQALGTGSLKRLLFSRPKDE
jgi:hypothetical protein